MENTFINETDIKKIADQFWGLADCLGCSFNGKCQTTKEECFDFWSTWLRKFNNAE